MKKNAKSYKSLWLILGIIAVVGLLLAIILYAQESFSHKIKQITFELSTGPVNPEYQQSTSIVLTPNGCKITAAKNQSEMQISDCPMDRATFSKIQSSIYNYGVIDKMIANDNKNGLIGGDQATMTIDLEDGTSFNTTLDPEFVTNLGPFFEQIVLLVPSTMQAIPSQ